MSSNFRSAQGANKRKTYFLLAAMAVLTWLVAYAALTYFGAGTTSFVVPLAVGISLVGVWGSYYGSDKLVLTMTGARVIQREDNPELFNLIEEVVVASGLPMPKVAIVEDTEDDAFPPRDVIASAAPSLVKSTNEPVTTRVNIRILSGYT